MGVVVDVDVDADVHLVALVNLVFVVVVAVVLVVVVIDYHGAYWFSSRMVNSIWTNPGLTGRSRTMKVGSLQMVH